MKALERFRARLTADIALSPSGEIESPTGEVLADEQILAPVYRRGDYWMRAFLVMHLLLAALLSPIENTWLATLIVAPFAFLLFWLVSSFAPGSFLTRVCAGIALQMFVGLHIYQLGGMAEMHFLFFTGVTMMVVYADWRCLMPAAGFIALQHAAFFAFHDKKMDLSFFELEQIAPGKLAAHFLIIGAQVSIVGGEVRIKGIVFGVQSGGDEIVGFHG